MVDTLGYRATIGIVVPSTNTVVQPESEVLRPHGVTNHVGRLSIIERKLDSEQAFYEHMEGMRAGIGGAIDQVMTCRPEHLIMGVALEAFWGGVEAAGKFLKDLEARAGVGVSMGSNATVAALERFGARRIAVLTPHQPRGDEMVRHYYEQAGYDVVRLIGLKCLSATLIAKVTEAQMRAAFQELAGPDIDAIVQVGTNLPGLHFSVAAERWLDKPILSINATTYWHALRQLGIDDRIAGHGRLMERF